MALANATITFDLSDHFGVDYDVRRGIRGWVDTNIPNDTVVDTDGNKVRVGSGKVTFNTDGTGSFTVWVPGVGSNPASWQTYFHVEYVDSGNHKKGRTTRTFGPFTITASADLADLIEEQEVPPDFDSVGFLAQVNEITGLTGEDDAVALLVNTPGSDTATALSATFARKTGLVDKMLETGDPIVIAHRGGFLVDSEHNMTIYRRSANLGLPIEQDLWMLADDETAVSLHEQTVDLVMCDRQGNAVTGDVHTFTPDQWRQLRVKPLIKGGPLRLPAEWSQIADEFGGRVILVPEVKEASGGGRAQIMTDFLIADIQRRGIERSVIVSTVSLTIADQFAAAGIPVMIAGLVTNQAGYAYQAGRGIQFVTLNKTTATQPMIADVLAGGMVPILYTVNKVSERTTYDAWGVRGYYTDDPEHVYRERLSVRSDADPFAEHTPWPGWNLPTSPTNWWTAVSFVGEEFRVQIDDTNAKVGVTHRWAGQRGNVRIRWRQHFYPSTVTDLNRFHALYVGKHPDPDAAFTNAAGAGQDGYSFLVRRAGNLQIYRVVGGVATQIEASATPGSPIAAYNAEGYADMELTITPTALTLTNRTTGLSITDPDTTYRATDWWVSSRFEGTASGLSRMTVNDL